MLLPLYKTCLRLLCSRPVCSTPPPPVPAVLVCSVAGCGKQFQGKGKKLQYKRHVERIHLAIKNKQGYFGWCHTEAHAKALRTQIIDQIFRSFQDPADPLYEADLAKMSKGGESAGGNLSWSGRLVAIARAGRSRHLEQLAELLHGLSATTGIHLDSCHSIPVAT